MLNTGVKQEFDKYKEEVKATDAKLRTELQALTHKFDESIKIINQQTKKIEQLEANVTSNLRPVTLLKHADSGESVHFHYFLSSSQDSSGIIKFDSKISESLEQSYDPNSGKFIAPCSGTFFFIINYLSGKDSNYVEFYIDNVKKTRTYMASSNHAAVGSLTIQLDKGQVFHSELKGGQIYGSSAQHSSLQGFQIN